MLPTTSRRPISPRLSIYRWRAPMLASLAHRASGLMLLALILFFLCFLHLAAADQINFRKLLDWMHSLAGQLFLCLAGSAVMYHWFNGLRFLLLDIGIGDSRKEMRESAVIALAVGFASLLLMAVWLWS